MADARVREAPGATLDFRVTLSRASSGTVKVDYRTVDANAKAGEDYTARASTLTFSPGQTAKTVRVRVLDDAHDEGKEKMGLVLYRAEGAIRDDYLAMGTIENADPLPRGWLARFGRTSATQVVGLLTARFDEAAAPAAQLTLGGRSWRLSDLRGKDGPPGCAGPVGARRLCGRRGVNGAGRRPAGRG